LFEKELTKRFTTKKKYIFIYIEKLAVSDDSWMIP
jgi:hypothetical protein